MSSHTIPLQTVQGTRMTAPQGDFSLALGRAIEVLSLRDIREHTGSPEQNELSMRMRNYADGYRFGNKASP